MSNKIDKEDLEKIVSQQKEANNIINDIGSLEAKKHEMLHNFASVNSDIEKFKSELQEKYGKVNIDLATGEYTPIEEGDE